MRRMLVGFVVCVLACAGCQKQTPTPAQTSPTKPEEGKAMGFVLTSTAFADGQAIPARHTGDGADQSPPLAWENAPKSTVELALVCEDPDAPNGDFVHWVAYGIPPTTTALGEGAGAAPTGLVQGRNDFDQPGYKGPAPPPGTTHHYRFRLMALDAKTGLEPNADKQALREAVKGHIIAEAEFVGTYER